jgi:hypothetical protein
MQPAAKADQRPAPARLSAGAHRACLRRSVDLRILREDRSLELLELPAWLDAEFVDRRASR